MTGTVPNGAPLPAPYRQAQQMPPAKQTTPRWPIVVIAVLSVLAVAIGIGLVALWPQDDDTIVVDGFDHQWTVQASYSRSTDNKMRSYAVFNAEENTLVLFVPNQERAIANEVTMDTQEVTDDAMEMPDCDMSMAMPFLIDNGEVVCSEGDNPYDTTGAVTTHTDGQTTSLSIRTDDKDDNTTEVTANDQTMLGSDGSNIWAVIERPSNGGGTPSDDTGIAQLHLLTPQEPPATPSQGTRDAIKDVDFDNVTWDTRFQPHQSNGQDYYPDTAQLVDGKVIMDTPYEDDECVWSTHVDCGDEPMPIQYVDINDDGYTDALAAITYTAIEWGRPEILVSVWLWDPEENTATQVSGGISTGHCGPTVDGIGFSDKAMTWDGDFEVVGKNKIRLTGKKMGSNDSCASGGSIPFDDVVTIDEDTMSLDASVIY